jgi:nicotinamidase-related amidase
VCPQSWEDPRVVAAIKKTGRKKLVVAALWTEICLAYPVLSALAEDFAVFIVTDASGAREDHQWRRRHHEHAWCGTVGANRAWEYQRLT